MVVLDLTTTTQEFTLVGRKLEFSKILVVKVRVIVNKLM